MYFTQMSPFHPPSHSIGDVLLFQSSKKGTEAQTGSVTCPESLSQ